MVDSNKILTVSYGTFSCTLEGFDDAFETMKAIAEYFRDLAADDRFFGAEPPTPDAEMLARIAERSSTRRVEAKQSDEGIVLRQDDTVASSEATEALPAAAAVAASVAAEVEEEAPLSEVEPTAETAVEEDAGFDVAALETAIAEEDAEDAVGGFYEDETAEAEEAEADDTATAEVEVEVAADEIEEDVTEEQVAEAEDEVEVEAIADEAEEDTAVAEEAAEDMAAIAEDEEEVEVEEPFAAFEDEEEDDVEAFFAETDTAEAAAYEDEAETVEPEPAADAAAEEGDSLLSKLRRIRSVVSRTRADEAQSAYFVEDQHAEGDSEVLDYDGLKDAVSTPANDEGMLDDTFEDETEAAETDALLAGALVEEDENDKAVFAEATEARDEDPAEEDAVYESFEAEFEEEADGDSSISTGWARVVKVKRADLDAAMADETDENEVAPATVSSLSDADEADLQNELAALEAEIEADVGTADYAEDDLSEEEVAEDDSFFEDDADDAAWDEEDAVAEAEEEDFDAEDTAEDEAVFEDTDEDDEALVSEADEAEEETAEFDDAEGEDGLFGEDEEFVAQDDEDAAEDDSLFAEDDEPEVAEAPAPAPGREKLAAAAEGDMDRILAETNNQLGESEGSRRRNAIAHLRAAVAATKAEKQAGSDLNDSAGEDHTDAYRQDLAQVVRPRRPRASGTPLRRSEDKPAPLRLVAEQRVDIDENREPVRPRRVSVADLIRQEAEDEDQAEAAAPASKGEGFAAFLETSGAEELDEVLEAAAAYLAFVEEREQFSRPQLMSRVREVDPEGYSREDALRAFGTLLREGKIRKVKGGRFSASDRIGFRPDQRAVG
ncbi:MAG: hypothetical protein ACU0DK_07125 [Pseudooceanicola sp.]